MSNFIRSPLFIFFFSFLVMWFSALTGAYLHKRQENFGDDVLQDLELIVAATLTLLGLIIGFSFSMATNRYDQRKNLEEAEANAIGTEYVRADFLSAADAARARQLLKEYLDQRIVFYETRDEQELQQINARTAQLQGELWSVVQSPAKAQPTPILGLVVSGMNDVLNSQGYSQAAFWNRIPLGAWALMGAVAICANLLVGYGARKADVGAGRFLLLPLVLSIAFFLIADIESPRRGVIRVSPQNLISLAQALR
jgi:hypothetical protein